MKLSISNIAWSNSFDREMYHYLERKGYDIEIAPTRIFLKNPYDFLNEAKEWAVGLQSRGIRVSSLQSIWYKQIECLFGSPEERKYLLDYTKKAILFAKAVGANNLVFGCPQNRNFNSTDELKYAVPFFKEIGTFAYENGTAIGMEANPKIYHTNYINTTSEAIDLVKEVNCPGFLLNLDVGTMISNKEDISILKGNEYFINHVHISEPNLENIKERDLHLEIAKMLKNVNYSKWVSLEIKTQEDINTIIKIMTYMDRIFN